MIARFFSVSFLTATLFSVTVLFTSVAMGNPDGALQAERMLSSEYWAQAVRIENTNKSSRYPQTVYGTVFEFQNTLWFYTTTGTQPLQASKNRTENYKNNLLPLLRTMERGFTSFTKLSGDHAFESSYPSLKNGCVIESIFSLNELKQQGEPILQAKLLLYSSKNPRRSSGTRATGHCVLVYQTPSGMFYVDPPKIGVTGQLNRVRDWDPAEMAREIESHYGKIQIEDAFFEAFDLPMSTLAQSS